MKTLACLFALTLTPAMAVDFVRQIQLVQGQTIVYDTPIANTSGALRSKPIEGQGAIFQLYAYEDSAYSPFTLLDAAVGNAVHANVSLGSHLLDVSVLGIHLDITLGDDPSGAKLPEMLAEKVVGAFIPEAVVRLQSGDPYFPPRTRADQPYTASIAIGRLPTEGQEIPEGVPTKVTLDKSYKLYHPTLHIPSENGSGQGNYSASLEFSLNGTYGIPSIYQSLPGNSPTKSIGEETFSAFVNLGTNGSRAKIASSTIQIWPVCNAEIQGIDPGKVYAGPPANGKVVLTDLYPDSVTYAQIYKGSPSLGSDGFKIPSSIFSVNTFAPQNTVVPLSDLIAGITDDGTYTIEVLTITPFHNRQPERVAHLSFELKRTISVRATMATME